jgi:cell wall-associated NlpC family hydrolase
VSPPVAAKQAQAAAVLAQINAIDIRLGHTVDAFDGARVQLAAAERSIAANRSALQLSSRNLKRALVRLAARLVVLYISDVPSPMDVLLGSASLQDGLDRLNAAGDVSAQDRQIAGEAGRLQRQLNARRRTLARERATRAATVEQLAGRRAEVERALAHRQQLLASIKGQIEQLRAQERAREQLAAAQARKRIARELASRRAAERAAAPEAAAPLPTKAPPLAPAEQTTTTTATATATTTTTTATTAAQPAPVVPAPAGGHPDAAAIAARYLGVPYRWGGGSPAGFDCSGLVMYVFAQLGISLPHYTVALYTLGAPVSRDQLQPGDLVFFDGLGHVGIYIGGGQFIHAPQTGDVVKVSSLSDSWFASTYVGARRI